MKGIRLTEFPTICKIDINVRIGNRFVIYCRDVVKDKKEGNFLLEVDRTLELHK